MTIFDDGSCNFCLGLLKERAILLTKSALILVDRLLVRVCSWVMEGTESSLAAKMTGTEV